jgi:hypothetical protein
MYRQLAIAVTEKHVREVYTPFNRHDDCSDDADINAILAWQSGHRLLQRGITYGLDGAYPSRLQPSLLRCYEWASVRWHEFLRQSSKNVPLVPEESPYSRITSRNALRFLFLTNHRLAFSPHISRMETHCVSWTALMKLENLKHETRRVSVG